MSSPLAASGQESNQLLLPLANLRHFFRREDTRERPPRSAYLPQGGGGSRPASAFERMRQPSNLNLFHRGTIRRPADGRRADLWTWIFFRQFGHGGSLEEGS